MCKAFKLWSDFQLSQFSEIASQIFHFLLERNWKCAAPITLSLHWCCMSLSSLQLSWAGSAAWHIDDISACHSIFPWVSPFLHIKAGMTLPKLKANGREGTRIVISRARNTLCQHYCHSCHRYPQSLQSFSLWKNCFRLSRIFPYLHSFRLMAVLFTTCEYFHANDPGSLQNFSLFYCHIYQ